jgi:predicted RNase H-like HicB family nuclease
MFETLKKKLLNQPEAVQAEQTTGTVEAQSTETIAEMADVAVATALLETDYVAKVVEMTAAMQAGATALEAMTAKYEAAMTALTVFEADKAKMVADALEVKMNARKEQIVLAVGTSKADGLMLATENLDDTAFNAVVSALTGSVDSQEDTKLFKEVGVAAQADPSKVAEISAEMKLLKAKYAPQAN